MTQKTCTIGNCTTKHYARAMCKAHYLRWYKHGDPHKTAFIRGDDIARFWSKVDKNSSPTGCWLWTGTPDAYGYGRFQVGGKAESAYVWAYRTFVGEIPPGYHVDHVKAKGCSSVACVNFEDHLEAVTAGENARRSQQKLSDTDVEELYLRWKAGGISQRALAEQVGVTTNCIQRRFSRLQER